MTQSMRSGSHSTKSSEKTSHELGLVETQVSVRTTDTNGAPLSTTSHSDQIPEARREEGVTHSNEEEEEMDLERLVAGVRRLKASVSNGSLRNFSRPTQPEVIEIKDYSHHGRSPFRPSAASWANATTEALAHLVPEVPQLARNKSNLTSEVSSPSPVSPSQVPAESHFKRVAPGVSLYSPSPNEQTDLTPLSQQMQLQQSVNNYLSETNSPTLSTGSTELPYRRPREKKQTRQKRSVAIYSSIPSSDYLAEHEEDDEEKPVQPRPASRSRRIEGYPEHATGRHTGPLGDLPRYAVRLPPIPGSGSDASPHVPRLVVPKTHLKQESLTSDDSTLNLARYAFPEAPSSRLVHLPPAPRHTPRNHRKEEPMGVVQGNVQSNWDYKRYLDDYPLNPPPYRTTQSPGRAPIHSGALYQSPKRQTGRGFPGSPRDDSKDDRISSPVSSPAMDAPYRPDPRASPVSRVRRGDHPNFRPSPPSAQPRSISPEPRDYSDGTVTDRRPRAIADDAQQGRPPSSAGHLSGFERRPTAEHVDHYYTSRSQSSPRTLPVTSGQPRETSSPLRPLPPMPLSHRQEEHGSRYHGTFEHGHFRPFDDQYSPNYGSDPSMRSSISTSVATPYDETSAASTMHSSSGLSTIYDAQDELDDREGSFVSMRPPYTEDNGAFYSTILDEYRHHNKGDGTPGQDLLKEHLRGLLEAAEALNAARAGTPGSIHTLNLTRSLTPVFRQKLNSTEVSQTPVVSSPIKPTRSSRMPNAEEEKSLHVEELNVPSRKPLSKMEKALLRRVEFGSNVDHSNLHLT